MNPENEWSVWKITFVKRGNKYLWQHYLLPFHCRRAGNSGMTVTNVSLQSFILIVLSFSPLFAFTATPFNICIWVLYVNLSSFLYRYVSTHWGVFNIIVTSTKNVNMKRPNRFSSYKILVRKVNNQSII